MSATYQDAMTPDEYNNTTEEKDLQAAIVAEAKALGWKVHSVWNSQHSPAGWPDLFLVQPQTGRRLALELKTAALGADHPETLIGLHNLGCAYRDAGQPGHTTSRHDGHGRRRHGPASTSR